MSGRMAGGRGVVDWEELIEPYIMEALREREREGESERKRGKLPGQHSLHFPLTLAHSRGTRSDGLLMPGLC